MKLLPVLLSLSIPASAFFMPVAVADSASNSHPVLNLDAQAYAEVQHDTVIITLQATKQSADQAEVTKALSETVSTVLEELKKQDKVKVSTGNYYVRPQQNKEGDITAWQGRSELILESTQMAEAADLAAAYQNQMPVANVRFTVSREARSETEQKLMTDVVAAFNQRAQTMTAALHFDSFEIKEMQLGGGGAIHPRSVSFAASPMMKADSAPIPLESGTEELSLSLSGSIYLLGKK